MSAAFDWSSAFPVTVRTLRSTALYASTTRPSLIEATEALTACVVTVRDETVLVMPAETPAEAPAGDDGDEAGGVLVTTRRAAVHPALSPQLLSSVHPSSLQDALWIDAVRASVAMRATGLP